MSKKKDGGRRVMRLCKIYPTSENRITLMHIDFHFESSLCANFPLCIEATQEEAAAFKQKIAGGAVRASKEQA